MRRILPAYPLWVIDPMFSVWANTDELNKGNTVFWSGAQKRVYGFVRFNGNAYSFMGIKGGILPLTQTSVNISAFSTDYTFCCNEFELKIRFISPLTPDNPEIMSCPVCYTQYEVIPAAGITVNEFSIALAMDEEFCYGTEPAPVTGGVLALKNYEAAYFTRSRNLILSEARDSVAPDWGDIYIAGEECWLVSDSGINLYTSEGRCENIRKNFERFYILCINRSLKGYMMTGYDDKVSVFYFGEWLKCYFFRNGKTIVDALDFSRVNHDAILATCEMFDRELKGQCQKVGKDYYILCCAALRQAAGAHKLVENGNGELLFLSRENNSGGFIGTVDVSYPSIPLFLLYNPELVNAMIRGIFRFAEMPVWSFDFAPHDLGAYPWCSGQLYGLSDKNGKYFCGSLFPAEAPVTPQFPYIMPAKNNVYDFNGQMPVEECGNMLIIAAAAVIAGADRSLVKRNFGTLKKWVKYLEKYGLQPENQLCTDDFAGHLANNVNLSIKALVGIESFSIICKTLGKDELAEDYFHRAERFAEQIKEFAGKDVMPLAYKMKKSYSVKYNILFDKLFGFNLIGKEICERETDYYITKNKRFGVPLDNRESYTKADWILWASAITDDRKKAEELYSPVLRYLKETPTRVPFGDWYYSDRGDIVHFINRSVVGAVFAPLLKLSGKMQVNWE